MMTGWTDRLLCDLSGECPSIETLAAFPEGRLAPDQLARIEAHAAGCIVCLDLVASLARTTGTASGRPRSNRAVSKEPPALSGTIVGRYVIRALIGRGGMADVYEAYDPQLDRRVAVKLVGERGATALDGEVRLRLLREAKAIARLTHPNVVVVHDAGTWGDCVFIAMELVEGETLDRWLASRPRTWREILSVFVGAGRGLAAAHAAGIVHRDFKPQNVIVGRDGKPRVADFGLAGPLPPPCVDTAASCIVSPEESDGEAPTGGGGLHRVATLTRGPTLTRSGALLGTPAYMAPEQFRAATADPRSDQFSFCVSLCEGLFGQRPFAGETVAELRTAVLGGHLQPLPERRRVPTWLRQALLRGLNTERNARHPTMDHLLAALSRDPARVRRRALGALALIAALTATVIGSRVAADRQTQRLQGLCRGAAFKLEGVWEPDGSEGTRRKSTRDAFLATQRVWALSTWEGVAAALDRYGDEWKAAYTEACQATHLRGEQSPQILDLRMACLNERLGQVKALTDLFASADASVVMGAVDAVGALGSVRRCDNVRLLREFVPPAEDGRMTAAVGALRPRLAAVRARRDAGRLRETLPEAAAVVAAARVAGYKPLLADALSVLGWLQWSTADPYAAVATLNEAFRVAEAGRDDETKAEVAAELSGIESFRSLPIAEEWANITDAILERLGPGHERVRSWVLSSRAQIRYRVGDFAGALRFAERGFEIKSQVLGTRHTDTAYSLVSIGNIQEALGDYDRALASTRRGLEILRRAYGDTNPLIAGCLSNLGEIYAHLGRHEDARASFKEALHLIEEFPEPAPRILAYPLTGLGALELSAGNATKARPLLERALGLREAGEPDAIVLAETRFLVARALWGGGRHRRRARALALQALDSYRSVPLLAHRRREVEQWLDRPRRQLSSAAHAKVVEGAHRYDVAPAL